MLVGALLAAVVVYLGALVFTRPSASSSSSSGGIALGSAAPSIALPATTGGSQSLEQWRGSKVVVYFYEGAG